MDIGKLRNQVDLFHPVDTAGPGAGIAQTYPTAYATGVWCQVKDLSVNQLMSARQVFSEVTTLIEMRWMTGVQPNDRVTFGSRIFNVLGTIDPDNGKQLRLQVMVKELSNGT